MKFAADLHVHSRYSRATSRDMTPEVIWKWARIKGIRLVGTGDFTHPAWFGELKEKLEPMGNCFFTLRREFRPEGIPDSCLEEADFVLSAEISCIFKRNGGVRKTHMVVLSPGMEESAEINERLSAIGNIRSDGRPILGLDVKKLAEIILDVSDRAILVPAHAWTPHFSLFGSASGFDSIEECFEDLAPRIRAIETGLSSDPPMNRRLSALDNITLISNSDAHSPSKLGREATLFDTKLDYDSIKAAMETGTGVETLEFFPEEGKYHYDGHRACGVSLHPGESIKTGDKCPVCGKRLTIGVLHRVEELADRTMPAESAFTYAIPLQELISETIGFGPNSKKVQGEYWRLLGSLGSELDILTNVPVEEIRREGGADIARAVENMRLGKVSVTPGYDGVYGIVRATGIKA